MQRNIRIRTINIWTTRSYICYAIGEIILFVTGLKTSPVRDSIQIETNIVTKTSAVGTEYKSSVWFYKFYLARL